MKPKRTRKQNENYIYMRNSTFLLFLTCLLRRLCLLEFKSIDSMLAFDLILSNFLLSLLLLLLPQLHPLLLQLLFPLLEFFVDFLINLNLQQSFVFFLLRLRELAWKVLMSMPNDPISITLFVFERKLIYC